MYVTDKKGAKVVCPHPGESRVVERVLNESNPETVAEFAEYWTFTYGIRTKFKIIKAKLSGQEAPLDLGQMIKDRTGFNSYCICQQCLQQFTLDLKRDQRQCPSCNSSTISTVKELIGKSCPQCHQGKIQALPTSIA